MIRSKKLLFSSALVLFITSCSNKEKDDLTNEVNKNGSVESSILVSRLTDSLNLLTTTHKVWVKGSIYKTIEYRDTLPALGSVFSTAENRDGDTKTVLTDKEYEIYITIK